MLKIVTKKDFRLDNFWAIISEMFFEYPLIVEWILGQIYDKSDDSVYLRDFFDSLMDINELNRDWKYTEEAEMELISNFRKTISDYWAMKSLSVKINAAKKEESDSREEKNMDSILNEMTF
jgi:hypothetical protein